MNFQIWFTQQHPQIPLASADSVLKLKAEGSTVPFIARYRKEQTGNLDEVAIAQVIDAQEKWDQIVKRQSFIVDEIEKQKKLTPELKEKLLSTFVLETLEDIYLPYKLKKKTKATVAKEAGLEPFADWLWQIGQGEISAADQNPETYALQFLNAEKEIKEVSQVLQGALDILVERISEKQELRERVRKAFFEQAYVRSSKTDKAKNPSKFEPYFNFQEMVSALNKAQSSHRYLAIRRGWTEEELSVSIGGKEEEGKEDALEASLLKEFENAACKKMNTVAAPLLLKAAKLSLKAYVLPSITNEVHQTLKELADEAAINVFAENVRKLLLASPFGSKAVLGVDPGIRTGCKLAVVDDAGKFLGTTVLHLQSNNEKESAKKGLKELLSKVQIRAVAVGNGTAGRETETFLREALKEIGFAQVPVVMVSEAGASVYSASEVAREEFADLDLTVRGAISIARRLQDPLAELVKVDPKSIGVGQYQHDVNQNALKKSLERVVDSCVNQVGVNINTASAYLLSHVSGIGPALAKGIVEYRSKNGVFVSREDLLSIPRFSKKTFEQAAGFLKIPDAKNPLDNTGIHPERYPLLEKRAKDLGKSIQDFLGAGVAVLKKDETLRKEIGDFTFEDIIRELEKPGRDPRESFVTFQFREDIHEVKDLVPGMLCPGIVTNVTNFGAFVDIGVHQDGLVHISQIADKFVKDPREVVSAGDKVQIKVLGVDLSKNQIALTMRLGEKINPSQNLKTEYSTRKPQANAQSKPQNQFGNSAFAGLKGMKIG